MDQSDNLSQKKKKDLVTIAALFGVLSEQKANQMTKQELLDFLAEQERSSKTSPANASTESSPDKQNDSPLQTVAATPEKPKRAKKAEAKAPVESPEPLSSPISPMEMTTPEDVQPQELPRVEVPSVAVSNETVTAPQTETKGTLKKTRVSLKPHKAEVPKPVEQVAETVVSTEVPTKKEPASSTGNRKHSRKAKNLSDGSEIEPKETLTLAESPIESNLSATDVVSQALQLEETQIPAAEFLSQTADVDTQTIATEITAAKTAKTNSRVREEKNQEKEARPVPTVRTKHRSVIIQPKNENISDSGDNDAAQESSETSENDTGNIVAPEHHHLRTARPKEAPPEMISGVLEILQDGYGFLRRENYLQGQNDVFVAAQYIRRFNLRIGDYVTGPCRPRRDNERYQALQYIKEVNGLPPEKMIRRPVFDRLTPIYPDSKYILETEKIELSTRIIDLIAPIGKGQRGMIVSPPKAGKTILLQKIANAISINNPDSKLIVLLIDERPEEVTDMQRSINGEVVFSTFDKTPENHVRITELVLERAMRLVELGQDVVILLDSITRLSRAYNLTINPTGRTLSGGLDPGALYGPKRFFGAARNIEDGGSLTIIATSLIETGSRMDEVIFEEFKGTGNMEVYLDRKLSEKRIFPAIDINKSGTRREELLLSTLELDAVWTIRKALSQLDTAAVTEMIISLLLKTTGNNQFVQSVNVSFNDKATFEAMRGTRLSGNGAQQSGGGK